MDAAEPRTRAVCVIGASRTGLATLVGLAELGWAVKGYDPEPERLRRVPAGSAIERDPKLSAALRSHLATGRIQQSESLSAATRDVELILIALEAPPRRDGSADLSRISNVLDALTQLNLTAWPTIVLQSSVPPGSSDRLARRVESWGELIYAPSLVREGSALHDFPHPGRIIVGCENTGAAVLYVRLFEKLKRPLLITSRASAEMIEPTSNAFFALKTCFANEIALVCDAIGASSDDVLRGIEYDRRVGSDLLMPDLGVGDWRFERDVRMLTHLAAEHDLAGELMPAMLRLDGALTERTVALIEGAVGSVYGLSIGVWGLTGTAGSDDHDTRAFRIVEQLTQRGALVAAYDPLVHVARLPQGTRLVSSALDATHADVLVVLAHRAEFRALAPRDFASHIRRRVVVDSRNALDPERVAAAGLRYVGIGRSLASSALARPGFRPVGIGK